MWQVFRRSALKTSMQCKKGVYFSIDFGIRSILIFSIKDRLLGWGVVVRGLLNVICQHSLTISTIC